jgi:hypothetical protein
MTPTLQTRIVLLMIRGFTFTAAAAAAPLPHRIVIIIKKKAGKFHSSVPSVGFEKVGKLFSTNQKPVFFSKLQTT